MVPNAATPRKNILRAANAARARKTGPATAFDACSMARRFAQGGAPLAISAAPKDLARFTRLRRRHPGASGAHRLRRRSGWPAKRPPGAAPTGIWARSVGKQAETLPAPTPAAARSLALKVSTTASAVLFVPAGRSDRGSCPRQPCIHHPSPRLRQRQPDPRGGAALPVHGKPQHRPPAPARYPCSCASKCSTGSACSGTSHRLSTAASTFSRRRSAPPTANRPASTSSWNADAGQLRTTIRPDPLDGRRAHSAATGSAEGRSGFPTPVMPSNPLLALPFEPAIEGLRG